MVFIKMAFLIKILIVCVFIAVASGKSIYLENINERLNDTNCSCDWRYFKHYEAKGCLVVTRNSCSCPEKFLCPVNQTLQAPSKVCTYHNKEYKVGSKIITSDVCQVCRCHDGVPPYISCITRECPPMETMYGEDCHLIYKENRCCPSGVECVEEESQITSNKTCEHEGRIYPFGSKIYPADDPCQICVCNENWNGTDNISCYQQECLLERNKVKLDAGCIPIYHESRCCPVEFYCLSSHNSSATLLSSDDSSDDHNNNTYDQCTFGEMLYAIGEELSIGNPCVKCTCAVPPEFTCVHQSCPPSPSNENCYANFEPGKCCPSYECMLGDYVALPDCPTPLCADSSCKIEVPLGHSCPTCVCKGCPTPLCADSSCRIETPEGHDCPTCVCGERASELEHNNLEQQVQQISQNFDEFEHVQQISEPYPGSSSDDDLEMMPLTMLESEGQSPVMEKMIALPETDSSENLFSEALSELGEDFSKDNSSLETASTLNEIEQDKVENSTSTAEINLDETSNESTSNQSEKVRKRSDISDAASNIEQIEISAEGMMFPQQETQDMDGSIEKEGSDLGGGNGYFEDELEGLQNRPFFKNRKHIQIINSVPPGCPTPMCEGPWCKIGILPGRSCPTCICKREP